jgi:hypothetical protein
MQRILHDALFTKIMYSLPDLNIKTIFVKKKWHITRAKYTQLNHTNTPHKVKIIFYWFLFFFISVSQLFISFTDILYCFYFTFCILLVFCRKK